MQDCSCLSLLNPRYKEFRLETKIKYLFGKINIRNYFLIISITGIVSLLWLLLLPSDLKTAWVFGYSKNRVMMLVGIIFAIASFFLLWLKMVFDKSWMQKFQQKIDRFLNKDLFWMIVLVLSSVGFVVGMCILSVAFGLTDIFLKNVFLRLAPWAFWITVVCILNLVYFWYGNYGDEKDSLLKIDLQSWESRYDVSPRSLFLIFYLPHHLYCLLFYSLEISTRPFVCPPLHGRK